MSNIHQLEILPEKHAINLIASYSQEFEQDSFNYHQLLIKLHNAITHTEFMHSEDNSFWMRHRGCDYLSNPKLFKNAPLTYLCAFLAELFKQLQLQEIARKIPPNILQAALNRLHDFK